MDGLGIVPGDEGRWSDDRKQEMLQPSTDMAKRHRLRRVLPLVMGVVYVKSEVSASGWGEYNVPKSEITKYS